MSNGRSKSPWIGKAVVELVVVARVHGERFAPADNFNPVDISLRQNILMAVARRRRVIVILVAHKRQG